MHVLVTLGAVLFTSRKPQLGHASTIGAGLIDPTHWPQQRHGGSQRAGSFGYPWLGRWFGSGATALTPYHPGMHRGCRRAGMTATSCRPRSALRPASSRPLRSIEIPAPPCSTARTLAQRVGGLKRGGPLAVDTGKFTGRSPKRTRFLVEERAHGLACGGGEVQPAPGPRTTCRCATRSRTASSMSADALY